MKKLILISISSIVLFAGCGGTKSISREMGTLCFVNKTKYVLNVYLDDKQIPILKLQPSKTPACQQVVVGEHIYSAFNEIINESTGTNYHYDSSKPTEVPIEKDLPPTSFKVHIMNKNVTVKKDKTTTITLK